MRRWVYFGLGIFSLIGLSFTQHSGRMTRPVYFETYKEIAIKEMNRSGVPASITLAQAALESGDGNSRLAREGNNHFGIKCHNDWNGKRIFEDDDAKNECFRKYGSVEESFRDHSDYLKSKTRYAFLFELKLTDYKGWARGLKKAGYATSPTYAEALIKIIEEHNLFIYDRMEATVKRNHDRKTEKTPTGTKNETGLKHDILERNRVKYVLAKKGDTYTSITEELDKLPWEIPEYNDIKKMDSIAEGQIIYIQPKRSRAETGKNTHVVKEGETMYTISQMYAIKLSVLYSLNNLSPGVRPSVGTILQLRKAAKKDTRKVLSLPKESVEEEEEIRIEMNLE